MQTDVKKVTRRASARRGNLTELKRGEHGILEHLDLPEDDARRLMEMGFLPGHTVTPAHSAPGGDPRVFRVDGSEVALRRETARKLILKIPEETPEDQETAHERLPRLFRRHHSRRRAAFPEAADRCDYRTAQLR